MPANVNPTPVQFTTGAQRCPDNAATGIGSKFPPRFDLISPIALRRWAETYGEGAPKYGDYNWTKGIPMRNCLDHALAHLSMWMRGDTSEDHLAHAMWNIGTMIHFSETRPDMDDRDERIMDCAPKASHDGCYSTPEKKLSKDELLERAWGIIANVNQRETEEWQSAAREFRNRYHETL